MAYCSFLPDVEVNRTFVARQLKDWELQRAPRVGDRWIRQEDEDIGSEAAAPNRTNGNETKLSELGKRLLGLEEWS